MEAVNVLGRVDRSQHESFVDVSGQRELDEDPVNALVEVQLIDERQELLLVGGSGQAMVEARDSNLTRRIVLAADVDVRCWIVPDEHCRQAHVPERGDVRCHLIADPRRKSGSVHQRGSHVTTLSGVAATELSLGEYELEEPWGRLVEVGRVHDALPFAAPDAITTYVLKDRTTRASSLECKSIEDAVALARFLDAHLAELRRFLLEQVAGDDARLRALESDVNGPRCTVTWAFSTGDSDPADSTERAIEALHEGFLARLAPVSIEEAELDRELRGGKAVLAACSDEILRIDLQRPSGPGYRDVQLAAAATLAERLA